MITTFLYQMGKVGAQSINHALYDKGINILRAHWLSGDFPEAEFPTAKPKILEGIRSGKIYPLDIISSVREPMARNLSAFVFNLIRYGSSGRQKTPEQLKKMFMDRYDITYPDKWFSKELCRTFDFNIYDLKFDHSLGYSTYKVGKHNLLIVRLEDANRVLPKAIEEFLGISGVAMPHRNKLSSRAYVGYKYKKLKTFKFSENFLDKVYNLEYVKHFYTENEIKKFKNSWM